MQTSWLACSSRRRRSVDCRPRGTVRALPPTGNFVVRFAHAALLCDDARPMTFDGSTVPAARRTKRTRGPRPWWRSRASGPRRSREDWRSRRALSPCRSLGVGCVERRGAGGRARARAFEPAGSRAIAADVVWVDVATPRGSTASARARHRAEPARSFEPGRAGEPSDLYLVEARLSPEGACSGSATPGTSRTPAASTSRARGPRARSRRTRPPRTASSRGSTCSTSRAARQGVDAGVLPRAARCSRRSRTSSRPARPRGSRTRRSRSIPSRTRVDARVARRRDARRRTPTTTTSSSTRPTRERRLAARTFVRVVPDERARPGNVVTWAVDRVRAMPWFGDDRMQWVKAVAFTALDQVHATSRTARRPRTSATRSGCRASTIGVAPRRSPTPRSAGRPPR